jgi:small subunit ribosomal protein S17
MSDIKKIKTLAGKVVSNKADKSIVVLIERKIKHELYGKYIKRSTKVHAHDEENSCNIGDLVTITQCRPLSKLKSWTLHQVVEKAVGEI